MDVNLQCQQLKGSEPPTLPLINIIHTNSSRLWYQRFEVGQKLSSQLRRLLRLTKCLVWLPRDRDVTRIE